MAETWIRADMEFGVRWGVLYLSRREAVRLGMPSISKPEELPIVAEWIEEQVARFRPELSGGHVVGTQMDFCKGWWLFDYVHESFDRVTFGNHPAEPISLIPQRYGLPESGQDVAGQAEAEK